MIDRLVRSTPLVRFLVGAGSFLLSFGLWAILWGSPVFAAVVMLSFFLHELGHFLAFRRYAVKTGMIFLFMGAATYPLTSTEEKLITEFMWVTPAGVMVNLGLGIAAFFLGISAPLWYLVAFINFYIAFFNLAPHTLMDGGKMVAAITYLFRTKRSEAADWLIITAEIAGIAGFIFLVPAVNSMFIQLLVVLLFGSDLFLRMMQAYPHSDKPHPKGLTERQAARWAAFYLGLVLLSLTGLILLPPTPIF